MIAAALAAACTRRSPPARENRPAGSSNAIRLPEATGSPVAGQVIDRQSRPVPGARVLLLPETSQEAVAPRRATTDADGRFTFLNAAPSLTQVLVEAPGFSPVRQARPIPSIGDLILQLEGDAQSIAGVVTRGGAPVPSALVLLSGENQEIPVRTFAAADGRFAFAGLGPGAYNARAALGQEASPASAEIILSRMPGAVASVRLALAPGFSLRGQVSDDNGAAMPDAEVRIDSTAPGGGIADVVAASATGQWTSLVLPPGEYRLTPRRAGFLARRTVTVVAGPAEASARPVALQLVRGSQVIGRVVDARGKAIAGAVVRGLAPGPGDLAVIQDALPLAAEAAAVPAGSGHAVGPVRSTLTDVQGRFVLTDLLPGKLRLDARGAGHVPARGDEFVLGPGQRRDVGALTLPDGLSVSGQVRDAFDAPLEGARVAVTVPGESLLAVTDGAGAFRLAVPPGVYSLSVSAPGMREQQISLTAATGAAIAPLSFKLVRADASLEGLVRDTGGRPITRAQVIAWPTTGAVPLAATLSDAGGHFLLNRLPPGPLMLEIKHPVYPPLRVPAIPGTFASVTVPIPGAVAGEVHEQGSGAAINRFRVEARGADGQIVAGTRKKGGAEGAFLISPLAPGRWTVAIEASGYAAGETTADVTSSPALGEASVRDLRIELAPLR